METFRIVVYYYRSIVQYMAVLHAPPAQLWVTVQ